MNRLSQNVLILVFAGLVGGAVYVFGACASQPLDPPEPDKYTLKARKINAELKGKRAACDGMVSRLKANSCALPIAQVHSWTELKATCVSNTWGACLLNANTCDDVVVCGAAYYEAIRLKYEVDAIAQEEKRKAQKAHASADALATMCAVAAKRLEINRCDLQTGGVGTWSNFIDQCKAGPRTVCLLEAKTCDQFTQCFAIAPNPTAKPKPTSTRPGDLGGYGKTKWGMSRKQVKTLYPKATRANDSLCYSHSIAGRNVVVCFGFTTGLLDNVIITLADKYVNKNKYIDTFESFRGLLLKKYGEPVGEEANWSDGLYRDNPEKHGMALSVGHVSIASKWVTPSTEVFLLATGENFEAQVYIRYLSLEAAQEIQDTTDQKAMDDL